jgi:8-amino-7-oxononanoate synthase
VSEPFGWVRDRAAERELAGLRRTLQPRSAAAIPCIDLASNDYLGLARHPTVVAALVAAARTWGAGSTGSRLVTGSTTVHADLEAALAAHMGAAAGLVLSSGYLANLAAVCSLSGRSSLVVSDAANHASLVDACRLSRARIVVTPHGDVGAVEATLARRAEERALVVTDAVFSVDGDLAPLGELAAACRRHDAGLLVDEAHAVGVVGDRGAGAVAAAGLAGAPDVVVTATLSKALGSQGGAVLATEEVVAHLVDGARAFVFDTGLAPSSAAAAHAALEVLQAEPQRVRAVRDNARRLHAAATAAGLCATEPAGAVTSVLIGAPSAALAAAGTCADAGVRVGCFRPPSVPDGVSRLRLAARADLSAADLGRAAAALHRCAEVRAVMS